MENNDIRNVINEIDDDELDMVAGGANGNGKGHDKGNGQGHHSHGKGWGKGHDDCGCDDGTATTELEDGADTYAAPAGVTYTCPFCGETVTVQDPVAWFNNHILTCPKAPTC